MNDVIIAIDLGRYKSVACISSRSVRKCWAKELGFELTKTAVESDIAASASDI